MQKKLKSTSIHNLNADRGLGFFSKFAYLFLNWLNNLSPYSNLDERIVIKPYSGDAWKKELGNTYKESSVGRRLSDLFWRTLPWDKIKQEFGGIYIFDTGCGHGNYGARLEDASHDQIASYTGIDAKARPNWAELKKEYPNFNFIETTSSDISSYIPKETNLFITQSAIEHFDEDIKFFEQIKNFIDRSNKPVIQIHLFPAATTLPLYLFHGLRQYNPRNVSKITRIFGDNSKLYLFGLGGNAGKRLHFKHFTWPLLILRQKATWSKDVDKYDREVREAIESDITHPSKSPIFWALIVHSNPKNKIW